MSKPYLLSKEELLNEFQTAEQGLTSKQAKENYEKSGANALTEKKGKSIFRKVIDSLLDPMILLLLAAAVLSLILNPHEIEDFIIIMAVVAINTTIGVAQESKAEKAIAALKTLSAPNALVMRDGVLDNIPASQLVPGDLVHLEEGASIPADIRLIETHSLKVEEAALTGESVPVEKSIATLTAGETEIGIGDRINMVHMSTTVSYGRGVGIVTETGMQTEVGKIAGFLQEAGDGQTPLQKRMTQLSKILTVAVLVICVVMFAIDFLHGFTPENTWDKSLLAAVALAVAAVPEGLAAIVTISMSMAVSRMVKKKALIRKLHAVETLGCAGVICSDKTGTLTLNQMTVTKTVTEDEEKLCQIMLACNNATSRDVGDPTETALIAYAEDKGITNPYTRLAELPFDSTRKCMSVLVERDGVKYLLTKGAPDVMAAKCPSVDVANIDKQNEDLAKDALRVLGYAFKEVPSETIEITLDDERGLTFAGLSGMIDPPRPEAKAAVAKCQSAGIRVIMITGDHKITASAIAAELGILNKGEIGVTGAELDSFSEEEFQNAVANVNVFARVSPHHKLRIVEELQRTGHIAAMTGDGVNDAPAIKQADIGVAMGITGTDVTKQASDVILLDDNFVTLVTAVEEGRIIYSNIRKTVHFLLSTNVAEVLVMFTVSIASMLFPQSIFKAVHLLFINLVTDAFPALALTVERSDKGTVMKQKPRPSKESFFGRGVGANIIWQGIVIAGLVLSAYLIGANVFCMHEKGVGMAFATMGLVELFQSLTVRSDRSLFSVGPFSNKTLLICNTLSAAIIVAALNIPLTARIFIGTIEGSNVPITLGFQEWGWVFALSFSIIPIIEIVKFIKRLVTRKKSS
jgi:ATPase, P-type (transporting), HAD superfamily, subfamily IC